MKQIKSQHKNNFFKKNFIKLCRFFGYEIIDQSNFYIPTLQKSLNEILHSQGKKSIVLPMGETKITRKVKDLTVIFRSCTNINMLTQNKKRLFNKEKSEYTFRSLNSIIVALREAKKHLSDVSFNIIIVDHNSKEKDINQLKNQLNNSTFKNSFISLNVDEFKNSIKKTNEKNQNVTDNQMSNMANIHKSLLFAKDHCEDLVYFVEDDYLHEKNAITEMIFTYERLASQTNKEIILCPTDYPYLYTKADPTFVFLGSARHWRVVNETLCTFLTSTIILNNNWEKFTSMCKFEHYPFEKPLHELYKSEYCFSPIPSLALHCTNVNSIFGLSPTMDWKKVWEENRNF